MKNQELEDRLIDFAILIFRIASELPKTKVGSTLESQIVRSGTSTALNYGEVQGAESRRDFIHKFQVVLKELRETFVAVKIIKRAELCSDPNLIDSVFQECNELISITVKSVNTAKHNQKRQF